MPYPEQMVAPMRDELVGMGVRELRTAAEVDEFFADHRGTALLLVNSVCGCAAGSARPAVQLALGHDPRPDQTVTVFAGQDLEATARAREIIGDVPPSSPSLALMKDGELVHFVPRHMIEGRDAQDIARGLTEAFTALCG
jgi:putative YphP/YqiW family bacilliredoxin